LFQIGQRLETPLFKFRNPAVVDLLQRHRVEEVQLFTAATHRRHQVRSFQKVHVLGDSLAGHIKVFAQFVLRATVMRVQQVEELAPARIGQCLEQQIGVVMFGHTYKQVITCLSIGNKILACQCGYTAAMTQVLTLAYAVSCIFFAAIVRGFSGFGFAMLAITSLSVLFPPASIVPSVFLLELAASAHLLPHVWRDIHWRALIWLFMGACIGTPFGVYALAHVPAAPMTLAIAIFVFAAAVLLAKGYSMGQMPGRALTFATGTASGLFSGGFGMSGPPVVLFFFSSPTGAAVGRASMIAFFFLVDLMGLAWFSSGGLIKPATLWRAAAFLPPLAAGVWLGNRSFKRADPAAVRRWVLRLLMLLALISGIRALARLA
jgi:uncharacterized protein